MIRNIACSIEDMLGEFHADNRIGCLAFAARFMSIS